MVVRLDAPQPIYLIPSINEIPDNEEDLPKPGQPLATLGPLQFPALHFGAASFSHQYNNDDHLASFTPVRTVRLALRYGIRSFDTSAYYGPSEIILGTALKAIEEEFPRSSYKLTTKCGRYGLTRADFDYSPATIRASVNRSLARLHTHYLDAVYLHDVEFVCDTVGATNSITSENKQSEGGAATAAALNGTKEVYGLEEGNEATVRGDGDRIILAAISELWKMKDEGLIKSVGITGYPLPTLLRIALLALHNPPFKPLDLVMSYSNLNLQNATLREYAPLLRTRAGVMQFFNASPLNMGLLTPVPPAWHPARAFPKLLEAARNAEAECEGWEGGLPNLALGYSMRHSMAGDMPVAVGLSSMKEVHASVKAWRAINVDDDEGSVRANKEREVVKVFEEAGVHNYCWNSP